MLEIIPGCSLKSVTGDYIPQSLVKHLVTEHHTEHVKDVCTFAVSNRPVCRILPPYKSCERIFIRMICMICIIPEKLVPVRCPFSLHLIVQMIGDIRGQSLAPVSGLIVRIHIVPPPVMGYLVAKRCLYHKWKPQYCLTKKSVRRHPESCRQEVFYDSKLPERIFAEKSFI